jgi:hypothetical protein
MELIGGAQNLQTALRELNNKLEDLGNAIDKIELTRGLGKGADVRKRPREDARNNNHGRGNEAPVEKKVRWS